MPSTKRRQTGVQDLRHVLQISIIGLDEVGPERARGTLNERRKIGRANPVNIVSCARPAGGNDGGAMGFRSGSDLLKGRRSAPTGGAPWLARIPFAAQRLSSGLGSLASTTIHTGLLAPIRRVLTASRAAPTAAPVGAQRLAPSLRQRSAGPGWWPASRR